MKREIQGTTGEPSLSEQKSAGTRDWKPGQGKELVMGREGRRAGEPWIEKPQALSQGKNPKSPSDARKIKIRKAEKSEIRMG